MSHIDDERLLRYRYQTLESSDENEVGAHLRTCSSCSARLAEINRAIDQLGQFNAEAELDDKVAAQAIERVWMKRETQNAVPASNEPASSFKSFGSADEPVPPGLWNWLGTAGGGALRPVRTSAVVIAAAAVTYLAGGLLYWETRSVAIDTRVAADEALIPGTHWVVPVEVVNRETHAPVEGAEVRVSLRGTDKEWKLFDGRTDSHGIANANADLPALDDGDYKLDVTSRASGEKDEVVHAVSVRHAYRVHLSTDKPLYQPGQMIHIRTLVLEEPNLLPPATGKPVTLEIVDPKGNRLTQQKLNLSRFGVGSADFELSDAVALGTYVIRVSAGPSDVGSRTNVPPPSELSIKVARYTLPKFKISVAPEQPTYLAGEALHAKVQARYFFGKPVQGGEVRVVLMRQSGMVLGNAIQGRTGADGTFTLTSDLPASLAAPGEPEAITLQVEVTDAAGQEEHGSSQVPVSRELLIIDAIPDGAGLHPNRENTVYVVVSTPDGRPAECRMEADFPGQDTVAFRTFANGVGSFHFTPTQGGDILLRAEDATGRRATRSLTLPLLDSSVLTIDTDKAFYAPGEPVHLQIQGPLSTSLVVVEASEEGQMVARTEITLDAGRGAGDLKLSTGTSGTVTLEASVPEANFLGNDHWRYRPIGTVPKELPRRRIVFARPGGLVVKMSADKETYRPGSSARVRFDVKDSEGKPKAAALGVTVVDESLFALAATRSDTARAFFVLERALLDPKHNVSAAELLGDPKWSEADQVAGSMLFSAAGDPPWHSRFVENTYDRKVIEVREARRGFESRAAIVFLVAILLGVVALVCVMAWYFPAWLGGSILAGIAVFLLFTPTPGEFVALGYGMMLALSLALYRQRHRRAGWAYLWSPVAVTIPVLLFLGLTVFAGNVRSLFAASANELAGAPMSTTHSHGMKRMNAFGSNSGEFAEMPSSAPKGALPPPEPPAPTALPTEAKAAEPPRREVRVREYFPETLFIRPEIIADESGKAEVEVPLADSITEWRVTAFASSSDGLLGGADHPIKVFQDFFVDVDAPVALIRGDQATLPIAVYNYLSEPQTIRIEIQREPWFEVVGHANLNALVGAGGVDGRELRIRVLETGRHKLTLHADGTRLSDAVAREIVVSDAGEEGSASASGTLMPDQTVRVAVQVPDAAVKGSTRMLLKLYPSRLSSALDGLEASLQAPYGCFEQTSSTTYPNVLIADYLKRSNKLTPEFDERAHRFISLGYQRLLGFEVQGGGFEWFGRAPANQILTAYGLMEFHDMARVFTVDEAVIRRTQSFLVDRQASDGSWEPDARSLRDGLWKSGFEGRTMVTAYIAWALAESGYQGPALGRALDYLKESILKTDDPYTLSIGLAAFARANNAFATEVVGALAAKAIREKDQVHFSPLQATVYCGQGTEGSVETTAMAAYALGVAKTSPEIVSGALRYLSANRDYRGTWYSTQGTILALRAILQSADEERDQVVAVSVNGADVGQRTLKASASAPDIADLGTKAKPGTNVVELKGQRAVSFQVVALYTLPWRAKQADESRPLSLDVEYGRSSATVGGIVPVTARLTYRETEISGMALVSLGVPAGLTPLTGDLDALKRDGVIGKYEVGAGSLNMYLDRLAKGSPITLMVRMKAGSKVQTRGVGSLAYLYYRPEVRASAAAVPLSVD
jgi:alpha-2-macroglobulin-like protein